MKKLIFLLLLWTGVNYSQVGIRVFKDTERDSIANMIKDTADVLRGEMATIEVQDTLVVDITVLNYAQFSTPEEYIRTGSTVTQAVQKAVDSAGTRSVKFVDVYTVTDSIKWDLNGGEIDITFGNGAKIISSAIVPTTNYYNPIGEIIIEDGKRVHISGGELYGNTSTTNGFQSVLCIRNVDEVRLENFTVRRGKYAGTRIINAQSFTAQDCIMDSSHYANLYVSGTKQSNVYGGDYSYAGYDVTYSLADTGYGITFTGKYPYPPGSSGDFDNENITVDGVRANYCQRKGIDSHGGINITFTNNKVKGFGNSGIYAVNEDGETGYEKHIHNAIISKNIVTQDSIYIEQLMGASSDWYSVLGRTVIDSIRYWQGIFIGDYQASTSSILYPSGVFTVEGNLLDSMNARGSRAPLFVFVATSKVVAYPRPQIDGINILNNTIMYPNVTTDAFGDPSTKDAVIFFTSGTIPPRFVNVSGNNIFRDSTQGNAKNGIKCAYTNPGDWYLVETSDSLFENITNINNNNIYGDFSYPLYISSNNIKQVTSNNTYNGKRLADMDDAYNGRRKFAFHAVADGDSLTLIDSVSVTASSDGMTVYDINIVTTGDVDKGINTYHFIAYAKDVSGTPSFTVTQMSESGIGGYTATDRPTIMWRTSDNVGTLKIFDGNGDGYSKHNIDMSITSRNVSYWRTE